MRAMLTSQIYKMSKLKRLECFHFVMKGSRLVNLRANKYVSKTFEILKITAYKMASYEAQPHVPGFSFENCRRNEFLKKQLGLALPKATKTGTTIVGTIFNNGVILGADTRATEGTIVSDKNCPKIHYIAENMYCCGAGTAADTEMTTQMIASQLKLQQLNTGREVPVATANRILKQLLFRYQGHIGAALVLGGVDSTGPHVYCIYPHGSTAKLPYATMGSGSLAAMAVFESKWKPNISEQEAKQLVSEAIQAGIFNDLSSGSNVDMCIIKKGSVEYIRPYFEANKKGKKQSSYKFAEGTTAVLGTQIVPIVTEEFITFHGVESMDVSS